MPEQEERPMPSAAAERTERYKMKLQDWWFEIKDLAMVVRSFYVETAPALAEGASPDSISMDNDQRQATYDIVAAVVNLYEELAPKMYGKKEYGEFKAFEPFIEDPAQLWIDTGKMFALIKVLRNALEKLGVLDIPLGE